MKIILNTKRNKWSSFCVISGTLVVYLSIVYSLVKSDPTGYKFITSIYFLINSTLLIFLGVMLRKKKFRFYNILSIILFLSVISGWFFGSVQHAVISGLIVVFTGGFIIIPLFHIAVIGSFVSSAKRLSGKIQYENEVSV